MAISAPNPSPHGGDDSQRASGIAGCLTYFAWSIGGAGLLAVLGILILRSQPWTFGVKDGLYWTTVVGMIAARAVDVSRSGAHASSGKAGASGDLRRYAAILFVVAALAWTAAQSVAL